MTSPPSDPTSFRVCFWNANSVRTEKNELIAFLSTHDIDIMLLGETWLKPAHSFKIPNYISHRNDRTPDRGGGTCILIKKTIPHHSEPTPPLGLGESTIIQLHTRPNFTRIISSYIPPRPDYTYRQLTTDLDALTNSHLPTIIAGDLNAKHASWHSRLNNPRGNMLYKYASRKGMHVSGPLNPTIFHSPTGNQDIIDIALFHNCTHQANLHAVPALNSDHDPVIMDISTSILISPRPPRKRTDWKQYEAAALKQVTIPHHLPDPDHIDTAVSALTAQISAALAESSTESTQSPSDRPDIPHFIKVMITTKNRARKLWNNFGDPYQRGLATRLRHNIRDALREHRNTLWNDKIQSLSTADNSIWKFAKALKNSASFVPPLKTSAGFAYSDEDKAEAFADSLKLQFEPNVDSTNAQFINQIHTETARFLEERPLSETHLLTSPQEVEAIIKNLPNNKAPGPDAIPTSALKKLSRKGYVALTNIFNASLKLSHFPKLWKTSHVINIPKPGKDNSLPSNYRPISLISIIGKTFEKVILARLEAHSSKCKLLPDEQHGFRAQHSTLHQLLRTTDLIYESFGNRNCMAAIFLDIAKAFDKVWHEGLLHKLNALKFPPQLVHIISSYLSNRTFAVKFRYSLSSSKPMLAGVPQGSILSPFLFNIYTSDIPKPTDRLLHLALYADDTCILARSLSAEMAIARIQGFLLQLETWFTKWRIKINPTKSSAIMFAKTVGPKHRFVPRDDITLFAEKIPWTSDITYLGLVLDSRLSWAKHIEAMRRKAAAINGALRPITDGKSSLSPKNKILLYKTMIRPVITYAAPIWGCARPKLMYKIQVIQNKLLRHAINAPWYFRNDQIHDDLDIENILEFITRLTIDFQANIKDIPNNSINSLLNYDPNNSLLQRRPKFIPELLNYDPFLFQRTGQIIPRNTPGTTPRQ